MKGFIEVTLTYPKTVKYAINVARIVWFSATCDDKKTSINLQDCTRFTVDETYDEVKALIAKAVQE